MLRHEPIDLALRVVLSPRERIQLRLRHDHLFVGPAHRDELADERHLQPAVHLSVLVRCSDVRRTNAKGCKRSPRLRFMSSYLMSAPPMMICGMRTSGTMLAAVFGSATSEETTRPNATPPIAVMNMIAEIDPKHPADLENVIADQDKEDALNEGKHAERERLRENVVRQPDVEIALALQDGAVADDVVGAVRQAEEHRDDQAEEKKRRDVIGRGEIVMCRCRNSAGWWR